MFYMDHEFSSRTDTDNGEADNEPVFCMVTSMTMMQGWEMSCMKPTSCQTTMA